MIINRNKSISINHNIGNKALCLLWLEENTIPTPLFNVVLLHDLIDNYESLLNKLTTLFHNGDQSGIDEIFTHIPWNTKNLLDDFNKMDVFFQENVSFRTSASLEDLSDHSFAGLYETFLNIPFTQKNFKIYMEKCFRSIFSDRVSQYVRSQAINSDTVSFSIIVQKMYPASFSGVAFVHNNQCAKIVFDKGLGKKIVDGSNAQECDIALNRTNDTPAILKEHKLDQNFQQLLLQIKKIVFLKEKGQDIEWSISDIDVTILQTREITKDIFLDIQEEIFDNTNISESYPSVVSPLTFSFIQFAYSKVYANFFQLVGVNKKIINKEQETLNNLLGYTHGRVYYKILNWYKMIKILPGYSYNKEFFESMLVPQKKISSTKKNKKRIDLLTIIKNIPLILKFSYKILCYKKLHRIFFDDFDQKYTMHKKTDLYAMSANEICSYYISLKDAFLQDWKVPILNDFRLMIFHGILKKIIFDLVQHKPQIHLNRMIANFSTNDDLQLIQELNKLARHVLNDGSLTSLFHDNSSRDIYAQLLGSHLDAIVIFKSKFDHYIQKFGDRRPDELILESPRISDDPTMLIDLIKYYTTATIVNDQQKKTESHIKDLKKEMRRSRGIFFGSIYGSFFTFVAHYTRLAIRFREQFRIKRAIVYGVARDCFLVLADKFVSAQIIKKPEDIFFLSTHEIITIANTQNFETDYTEIIKIRKKVFDEYKKRDDLPQRMRICGIGPAAQIIDDCHTTYIKDRFHGLPTSQGIARGEAIVLKKFDASIDVRGKIVVTYQTDPGWSLIFPLIKGIILEKGNTLSHAAILSRELGIPSVVRVKDAVKMIHSGDHIEINGNTGMITIIHI